MDLRTGKVFDLDGRELTRDEASRLTQEPIKISGSCCTDYCALAFKRGCFTVAPSFRDKCTCFRPQRNANGGRSAR